MALNNLTRIGNSGFGTDTSINTTGIVTAASFSGDGSGLTGITAVGSGVVVREEGSNVGTAQTINFIGTGVTATISGGVASIEIATSGGGGGGGLSDVISDTTPQLGGNLDVNGKDITGTGSVNLTGVVTATTFSGSAASLTSIPAGQLTGTISDDRLPSTITSDVTGNAATATTATNVTVANEASDTECFVMFGVNDTGNNAPKSSSSLKYNSSSGGLTAGSFIGDGSGLTGITASGSGVIVRDGGSLVGTAGTIDFGSNVSVSPISAGVVTVTASAGSIPGINTSLTTQLNNLTVAGVSTFNNVKIVGSGGAGSSIEFTSTSASGSSQFMRFWTGGTHYATLDGGSGSLSIHNTSNPNGVLDFRAKADYSFQVNGYYSIYSPSDGGVKIYHPGSQGNILSQKFETLGAGVTVAGTTFSNQLSVSGVSTFTDNVILNANLDLQDGDKILLGSGDDLEIYHSGSHSFIVDSGVGDLYIRASGGYVQDQGNANQSWLQFNSGAGVEAHFAGSKKLETTTNGVTITGTASATTFSGSGANLTNLPAPTPADTDVQVTYDVSSNGSSGYRFTGPGYSGADDNPDIYLVRGQRYRFINGTGSGHPFRIQSDTSGTAYTDGVSGSQSGTQDFNVQHDAPVRLYYQCTIHSGMIGNIYVVGGSDWRMTDVAANATPEIFTNLNVGIGTDNPNVFNPNADDLVISGTGHQGLTIRSGNAHDGSIMFNDTDDANQRGIIRYIHGGSDGTDNMAFHTSGGEAFRIKSNGVVQIGDAGLGSDNGDRKLDIIGSGNGQAGLLIANNAISASGTCDISFAPSNKVTGAQIICVAQEDFSSSANRTADLTFQTRKDGTLSEKLRIQSAGGISFNGDTAAANALDDYEEGEFTITLSGGVTINTQTQARYVKIGQMVMVTGQFRIDNDNSNAALRMTNLPFVSLNTGSNDGGFSPGAIRLYNYPDPGGYGNFISMVQKNSNDLYFYYSRNNATDAQITASSQGYVAFSCVYHTAS